MKKSISTLVIVFLTFVSYGQEWLSGTSTLYTDPITTKVGIGTDAPQYKLDVLNEAISGSEQIFRLKVGDASDDYFQIANATGTTGQFIPNINAFRSSDNRQVMFLIGSVSDDMDEGTRPIITFDARRESSTIQNRPLFSWASYGSTKMMMLSDGKLGIGTTTPSYELDVSGTMGAQEIIVDGKIGIGTTSPSYELDVAGTIHTQEVKVDMTGWSDFVFHPTYNLRPLQEVHTYIQQNGHLPEIPTAKEVEENGISLGEMNAKLLQKIEELTLYVIEQDKTTQTLIERVNTLEEENKSLKKQQEKIYNKLKN